MASLNPYRITSVDLEGHKAELHALDTRVQMREAKLRGVGRKVMDGPAKLDQNALYEQQRVLVSGNFAHLTKLGAGDEITLETPSGPQRFTIYAVVVDYSSDQGLVMIDRRWYMEYWHDEPIDTLEAYFVPGANREQVGDALRSALGQSDNIFVVLHDTLRDELRGIARSVFAYTKAPELITLLVAVMGVIGTMLAAVIDRIREIGMLRAIGATRWQVTTSMMTEAGFLGFAAAVCGVVVGVPQAFVFMRVIGAASNGWELPYCFPYETAIRVTSFVVIAAALAGLFSGRRAAGLDVKDALAYE